MFFSEYMPSSRIAGSYGSSLFSFVRTLQLFSTVAIPVYIPTSGVEVFSFLHILSSIYYLQIFWWWPFWLKGFPGSSAGQESTCNAGNPSLIPGLGRSPREGINYPFQYSWASLVTQILYRKNLPAMLETWVQSLGWEDPLEEGMSTYSSILAWRIP